METTARTNASSGSGSPMASDSALGRAAAGAHGAVDKVAGVADQTVRSVGPAIDRVAAIAHQAVDKASSAAAPTAEWLSIKGDSLKARSKMLVDDSCRFVATKPVTSIGIALAVGVLIGLVIRSSSGSRS
jgi:ElaB/YqjD/DUF883 family membrane-anchored ribosome-binding protein